MRYSVAFGALALALTAPPAPAQPGMAALRAAQATVPAPTLTERYGPDDLRSGELRLPPGRGPFPVAVVIHGGCWRADVDTVAGITPLAEALRRRGVATWSIEYRRVGNPGGGWPGTFEDVAAGTDHLARLARRHPLDLKRVALVGHSAGAHLALWAASRPKLGLPWSKTAVKPVAVAAIDGPAALAPFVGVDARVCGRPVIVPLMGGAPADKPAEYKLASPADHLPLGLRQLVVVGEFGPFMNPYIAAVKASGDPVDTLAPEGANHFDIVTPGTPNGDAVADFVAQRVRRFSAR